MPSPVELLGQAASPGIAAGPLVRLDAPRPAERDPGDPAAETAALQDAMNRAAGQLARLAEAAAGEAADMLAFQIALLEDDNLRQPVLEAIAAGRAADAAWSGILDDEIATYETAQDEYFRARAADLADLCDRVLRLLTGTCEIRLPPGAILAGRDMSPTLFLETDWSQGGGLLLKAGSTTSHVAILARARGVPMVVGVGSADLDGHREAIVHGTAGRVVLSPGAAEKHRFETDRLAEERQADIARKHLHRPARTADGAPVQVLVNIEGPDDLARIDRGACDGIGLMRTEFLFRDGEAFPDEETQYLAYRRLLEWAGDRPVTIRTLDVGGDKPIRGLTVDEANPFLGLRGLRLSLARSDVFAVQLRALARAAPHGRLKVMWPMVTVPDELVRARGLFEDELARLLAQGIPAALPPLGMMVEVPAPAITPELYGAADFFSIGSNDLIQYLSAAARDNPTVAALADGVLPAVLRLIEGLARFSREQAMECSICGNLASEPDKIPALLKAGLRSLSVAPAAIGSVKAAVAGIRLGETS